MLSAAGRVSRRFRFPVNHGETMANQTVQNSRAKLAARNNSLKILGARTSTPRPKPDGGGKADGGGQRDAGRQGGRDQRGRPDRPAKPAPRPAPAGGSMADALKRAGLGT